MAVKKRLTQSNVIMILVSVIITSLIIACCACGAYIVLRSRSGIAFEKSGDFRKTVTVASEEFHEMFEHGTDSKKLRISSLANTINYNGTLVKTNIIVNLVNHILPLRFARTAD